MGEIRLTEAQQGCVDYPCDKDLIVTGVAGSGKSLVVLNRAVTYCRKVREMGYVPRVALFTYVKTLVKYSQEVVDKCGLEAPNDINVSTLDSEILRLYESIIGRLNRSAVYDGKTHKQHLKKIVRETPEPEENSRKKYLTVEKLEWLMAEVEWIKQHMFKDVASYMQCVRKGRGREQLRREDRPFIFDIYERYYQSLAKSRVKTIDMICEELYQNRNKISDEMRYDMVLIDEAQDLPLNKLLIARELAMDSVTISADFAQKIYKTGFTWKEIGLDVRGSGSKKLVGTHRNTQQIALLADSLLKHATEEFEEGDLTNLKVPDRNGPLPRLILSSSIEQQEADIVGVLRNILQDEPNASVGLLVRSYKERIRITNLLRNKGVQFEEVNGKTTSHVLTPGVKLMTYHGAKGLEFDQVLLPLLQDGYFPQIDSEDTSEDVVEERMNHARHLLFVGMTRARQMLYMFATSSISMKPSPLLEELDDRYMEVIQD